MVVVGNIRIYFLLLALERDAPAPMMPDARFLGLTAEVPVDETGQAEQKEVNELYCYVSQASTNKELEEAMSRIQSLAEKILDRSPYFSGPTQADKMRLQECATLFVLGQMERARRAEYLSVIPNIDPDDVGDTDTVRPSVGYTFMSPPAQYIYLT